MRSLPLRAFFVVLLVLGGLFVAKAPETRAADDGWVVTSFNASYVIEKDGAVDVQEDISVDFGGQQKHGIFRDIPIRYRYDDKHNRVIEVTSVRVTQDDRPVQVKSASSASNLHIQIGDPNNTISGPHSYHISYQLSGGLNPFTDRDELFLNVTGNGWPVPIRSARAHVEAPANIGQVACYEGPAGSTRPCGATAKGAIVDFATNRPLDAGEGMTFVTSLPKGAVTVAPPVLEQVKSSSEKVRDFFGLYPPQAAIAVFVAVLAFAALMRLWWLKGRDRWSGDAQVLSGATADTELPLFAHETVVPEYTPPAAVTGGRQLRPAELGVLMDEHADTLDCSATIIDLAVRGYLRIRDLGATGLFGMGSHDFELTKLKDADEALVGYEVTLLNALFDSSHASVFAAATPVLAVAGSGDTAPPEAPGLAVVKLSELKNKFASDLKTVKSELYDAVTKDDGLFPGNPETVRVMYLVASLILASTGAALTFGLGIAIGAALVGIPIVAAGLVLAVMSQAMPRRTAQGRETYRCSLGFREFMQVTTDEDKLKFEEEKGIFDRYLPYAIVFHCTAQWAKRFEGLGGQGAQPGGWYLSPDPFLPLAFAGEIDSFSAHVSTVMASTPGGSGGSGFGSGGFSGGGIGGGGGGSW